MKLQSLMTFLYHYFKEQFFCAEHSNLWGMNGTMSLEGLYGLFTSANSALASAKRSLSLA